MRKPKPSGEGAPNYAIGPGQGGATDALEYTTIEPGKLSTVLPTGREATNWLKFGEETEEVPKVTHVATQGEDQEARARLTRIASRLSFRPARRIPRRPLPPQGPNGGPGAA